MAGSYNHVVDEDGKLLNPQQLNGMIETGGDVYEAVEEMYGMIWWLADSLSDENAMCSTDYFVEEARKSYKEGLTYSPGTDGYLKEEPE